MTQLEKARLASQKHDGHMSMLHTNVIKIDAAIDFQIAYQYFGIWFAPFAVGTLVLYHL